MIFTKATDFRKSITLKLELVLIAAWVLAYFFIKDQNILKGSIENIWQGKYWLPLLEWVGTKDFTLQIAYLYAFSFFGYKAEQSLGQKAYLLFLFSAHSISVLLSLLMLQNLGGGLTGVCWALIVLYLLPSKYQVKRGLFLRLFVFFISLQFFMAVLMSYDIAGQIFHFIQCMLGIFSALLFIVLAKFKNDSIRQNILLALCGLLWVITFYNPFHYLWEVSKISKEDTKGRAAKIEELLASSEGRTRFELAWRVLKGEFPSVDKDIALKVLRANDEADLYTSILLAQYYIGENDPDAKSDSLALRYLEALPLANMPDYANAKAAILCGSLDEKLVDGVEGMKIIEEVNEITTWKNPVHIDTYAACLARQNKFLEASQWLNRAILMTDTTDVELIKILKANLERVDNKLLITYPLKPISDKVLQEVETQSTETKSQSDSLIDGTLLNS